MSVGAVELNHSHQHRVGEPAMQGDDNVSMRERSQQDACIMECSVFEQEGTCGSTSSLHKIIIDDAPSSTKGNSLGTNDVNHEPIPKRCRVLPSSPGTVLAEPVLATPIKHSYTSNIPRPDPAPNLEDEHVVQLIMTLLRRKGEPIAKLIQQRVANGQGAFLLKKDQFIEAKLLERALERWRSSQCDVARFCTASDPHGEAASSNKVELTPGEAMSDARSQQHQSSSVSSNARSPLRLKYDDWKRCAKMVECGIAPDITAAASSFRAAGGDPDLAAAMLLSKE